MIGCVCSLSGALEQVMGDSDWRNGWLLKSHLEWIDLITHMPHKHTHTQASECKLTKVFVNTKDTEHVVLYWHSSAMSSAKSACITATDDTARAAASALIYRICDPHVFRPFTVGVGIRKGVILPKTNLQYLWSHCIHVFLIILVH